MTPDFIAGILLGIFSTFLPGLVLLRRVWHEHDNELDETYERGRRRGVHETWTTYVGPMEAYIKNEFGRDLNWPAPDCIKRRSAFQLDEEGAR